MRNTKHQDPSSNPEMRMGADAGISSHGEQLELDFSGRQPFPPILTLREFVAQVERDYGSSLNLDALRAAMEEPS